jgi:hypothetical protein
MPLALSVPPNRALHSFPQHLHCTDLRRQQWCTSVHREQTVRRRRIRRRPADACMCTMTPCEVLPLVAVVVQHRLRAPGGRAAHPLPFSPQQKLLYPLAHFKLSLKCLACTGHYPKYLVPPVVFDPFSHWPKVKYIRMSVTYRTNHLALIDFLTHRPGTRVEGGKAKLSNYRERR